MAEMLSWRLKNQGQTQGQPSLNALTERHTDNKSRSPKNLPDLSYNIYFLQSPDRWYMQTEGFNSNCHMAYTYVVGFLSDN